MPRPEWTTDPCAIDLAPGMKRTPTLALTHIGIRGIITVVVVKLPSGEHMTKWGLGIVVVSLALTGCSAAAAPAPTEVPTPTPKCAEDGRVEQTRVESPALGFPIDAAFYGLWPLGGAWLSQHLWYHYEFHPDKQYLAEVYPVLKGSAQFFLDTLVEHAGEILHRLKEPEKHITIPD